MYHDVQTLTDANAGWWEKGLALGDLTASVIMDINMLDGAGEAMQAARIGAQIAEKGATVLEERGSSTLFHYTSEEGLNGILKSKSLHPSLNPRFAHYGPGQYLTDIAPEVVGEGSGKMSLSELSQNLFSKPYVVKKLTHYVEIGTDGLDIVNPRENVFLVPNEGPLDIGQRIIRSGTTLP